MAGDGRHFLFGITVSEIAFILFFLLVLLSTLELSELTKEKDAIAQELENERNAKEDISDLRNQVEAALGANNKTDLDEIFTKLLKGVELQRRLDSAEEEVSKLASEVESQKVLGEQMEALKEALGTDDPEEVQEALEALEKLADESLQGSELDDLSSPEKIESLAQGISDMKGQLENMRNKIKVKGGEAIPPCWPDPNDPKQPDFTFDVTVFTDKTVTAMNISPPNRLSQYSRLPNTGKLTSGRISLREFAAAASAIKALGVQNGCVYYVKVDVDTCDAGSYISDVENYFYKHYPPHRQEKCSGI